MQLARSAKQIGNEIRRQRKRLGMTQGALGEKVGLRQATISQIESGQPGTKLDTILSVLAALDMELRIAPRTRHSTHELEERL